MFLFKIIDEFCYRCNKGKNNSRNYDCNQSCMQMHLYQPNWCVGHCGFLEQISIILIGKTNPSDPFKREIYWRQSLCTMAPHELDIEGNVWSNSFRFLIVKSIFIFYKTFAALRSYDKQNLLSFTIFTTVQ